MAIALGVGIGIIVVGIVTGLCVKLWEQEKYYQWALDQQAREHLRRVEQLIARLDEMNKGTANKQKDDETFWDLINSHNWSD